MPIVKVFWFVSKDLPGESDRLNARRVIIAENAPFSIEVCVTVQAVKEISGHATQIAVAAPVSIGIRVLPPRPIATLYLNQRRPAVRDFA